MPGVQQSAMSCMLVCTAMLFVISLTGGQQVDRAIDDKPAQPNAITFEELSSNIDNHTVVDVRRRDEIVEFGQIPGSHVLPLQELEESLGLSEDAFWAKYGFPKLKKDDSSVVLTCRSGNRIQQANRILVAHGYTKQRLYYGSYLDWVKNNGTLIKPGRLFEPGTLAVTEASSITPNSDSDIGNSTIPKEFIIF